MDRGRPLKYKTVEDMQKDIEKYFNDTPEEKRTVSGLALHLDMDTQTLLNYQSKDNFFATVKRAKQLIENAWELRLIEKGRSGDIFALKNFGWKDTQDINHGGQHSNPLIVSFDKLQKDTDDTGVSPE